MTLVSEGSCSFLSFQEDVALRPEQEERQQIAIEHDGRRLLVGE